jgi:hypothetical protein
MIFVPAKKLIFVWHVVKWRDKSFASSIGNEHDHAFFWNIQILIQPDGGYIAFYKIKNPIYFPFC